MSVGRMVAVWLGWYSTMSDGRGRGEAAGVDHVTKKSTDYSFLKHIALTSSIYFHLLKLLPPYQYFYFPGQRRMQMQWLRTEATI